MYIIIPGFFPQFLVSQFGNKSLLFYSKAYVCGEDEKDARCDRSCANQGKGRRKKRDVSVVYEDYEIVFPNHTIFHMEKGPIIFEDIDDVPTPPEIIPSGSTLALSGGSTTQTAMVPVLDERNTRLPHTNTGKSIHKYTSQYFCSTHK